MSDKRTKRNRYKLKKVSSRNRLSVFRSNNHIYAQVIDDKKGITIVSASTIEKEVSGHASCKRNNIDIKTAIIPINIPVTKNCLEIIL